MRGLVFSPPHPTEGLAEVFSVIIIRGMSSPAFCLAEWSGLSSVNISSWYSPRRRERGWSGLLGERRRRGKSVSILGKICFLSLAFTNY